MAKKKKVIVCLDFGNVILSTTGVKDLRIPPVPESFKFIEALIERAGADNVHIVSRCSEDAEEFIKDWLKYHNFFEQTGFHNSCKHTHFCRERHQKAPMAGKLAEEYESVIMVDDRWSVLEHFEALSNVKTFFGILFNPDEDEDRALSNVQVSKNPFAMDSIFLCRNWQDAWRTLKLLV